MKIEVDLLALCRDEAGEDMARVCAVALLSALPQDEAELAVAEWRAVLAMRASDEKRQREDLEAKPDLLHDQVKEAVDEWEAGRAARAAPPQDAGYSTAPDGPYPRTMEQARKELTLADKVDFNQSHETATEHDGSEALIKQPPAYKVGDWVVTDLGELAKIVATKVGKGGAHVVAEIDEGNQTPTEVRLVAERLRPATVAEVTAGTARAAMVDRATDSVPERSGEQIKKQQRRKKAVVESASAPNGEAAEPVVDERTAKYADASIRDLCKLAEHHAGTPKVVELFKRHGVGRLAEADAEQLGALRADVLELVP